jgi:hypothetical protein
MPSLTENLQRSSQSSNGEVTRLPFGPSKSNLTIYLFQAINPYNFSLARKIMAHTLAKILLYFGKLPERPLTKEGPFRQRNSYHRSSSPLEIGTIDEIMKGSKVEIIDKGFVAFKETTLAYPSLEGKWNGGFEIIPRVNPKSKRWHNHGPYDGPGIPYLIGTVNGPGTEWLEGAEYGFERGKNFGYGEVKINFSQKNPGVIRRTEPGRVYVADANFIHRTPPELDGFENEGRSPRDRREVLFLSVDEPDLTKMKRRVEKIREIMKSNP